MYQVRVRKFEKRNWKVVENFQNLRDAKKFAIRLDMRNRKSIDTMYDHIDIKYPDGTRFIIA